MAKVARCRACGNAFMTTQRRRIFCSEECAKINKRLSYKKDSTKPENEEKIVIHRAKPVKELWEMERDARKVGLHYGMYTGLTEYPVKIERKW